MNSDILNTFRLDIPNKFPHIMSLLVLRHGKTAFEEYYNGTNVDSLHHLRSATKSLLSALIGIALSRGDLKNIDQNAAEFFPEYITPYTDERIKDISLKHLLTMTSGIPYDFMVYIPWTQLNNPIKEAFEATLEAIPGEKYNYNDPGVQILSGILSKISGGNAADYAEKYLFNELGISDYAWPADRQGNNIGYAELELKTRDIGKLGQLYLDKGKWKGKQLLSPEWVYESTKEQSGGGAPGGDKYGYLWWVTNIDGYSAYYAFGFGGQFIYVVPDLDLVLVITSALDGPHLENKTIISKYIIPSI